MVIGNNEMNGEIRQAAEKMVRHKIQAGMWQELTGIDAMIRQLAESRESLVRYILKGCLHTVYARIYPSRRSQDKRAIDVCVICGQERSKWKPRKLSQEERRRIDFAGNIQGRHFKWANVPMSRVRKSPRILDGPVTDLESLIKRCLWLWEAQKETAR